MARTIPANFASGAAAAVTEPGYLVEMLFAAQTIRLSSRGDITLSGQPQPFVSYGFAVDVNLGLGGGLAATLRFQDLDGTIITSILAEGIADRTVNIWKFYGTPTAAADLLLVFSGVGDEVDDDPEKGEVTLALIGSNAFVQTSPRFYITKDNGFNWLPPAGKVITWEGERYVLEPDGNIYAQPLAASAGAATARRASRRIFARR